jgi:hypothetical protein
MSKSYLRATDSYLAKVVAKPPFFLRLRLGMTGLRGLIGAADLGALLRSRLVSRDQFRHGLKPCPDTNLAKRSSLRYRSGQSAPRAVPTVSRTLRTQVLHISENCCAIPRRHSQRAAIELEIRGISGAGLVLGLLLSRTVQAFSVTGWRGRRSGFGDQEMKNLVFLFVVWVFCAMGTMAQVSGSAVSGQAHPLVMSGNPQRASQAALAVEHNLMERSGATYAKGERPLWEVMPEAPVVPLGDSARALRKEHAAAKKAVRVWSN